ncbi:MAG TPA: MYXO-CTERM sorting domain-containing protein, partial [Xanthomonadales bacterium]|nr:MYXO-CTERM sorting domain-containing protein [Xanthomonadales bacterium]
SGELVAGTTNQGTFRRAANAATPTSWDELANAPHINCLVENSAGEVWACTQNYGIPGIPMDGFGIMKTTDLVTWTGVLRYQEIFEPVACPEDTLQYTKCDRPPAQGGPLGWCGLCAQLGCDPKRNCMIEPDGAPQKPKDGCCSTGDNSSGPAALGFSTVVGIVLLRRRRRR